MVIRYFFRQRKNLDISMAYTHRSYGDPLTEASIETTLRLVERAMKADNYRRYAPFEALLRTLYAQEKEGNWGELAVLHYGY